MLRYEEYGIFRMADSKVSSLKPCVLFSTPTKPSTKPSTQQQYQAEVLGARAPKLTLRPPINPKVYKSTNGAEDILELHVFDHDDHDDFAWSCGPLSAFGACRVEGIRAIRVSVEFGVSRMALIAETRLRAQL